MNDNETCPQCDQRGVFGYKNPSGGMTWFCANHRLGRFYADARRDGSSEPPGLRDIDRAELKAARP
jgi:hypothetical protein